MTLISNDAYIEADGGKPGLGRCHLHDRDILVIACGRIRLHCKKINVPTGLVPGIIGPRNVL